MVGSKRPGRHHGFLIIDKPAGWTSHDVVARVRRLIDERRVGHAGTLDPAATGVLPIAVGDATRVVEYLTDASKSYVAEVTFGISTDSADGDGRVTRVADARELTADAIASALLKFVGRIEQVPPMHSAVRVGGRRLYELARTGVSVERQPRQVHIFRAELLTWTEQCATIAVDCSKGTYIRSIAQGLG
ncbi:MAG: tRNA pseudouridine(55) synthase TruB, partial [Chloroflexota bacterium]|nr:tRNA pseudouridine(55) synthase TruB [Chloroflexota bacterium]